MRNIEDTLLKEMKDHAETLRKLKDVERWALIWKECAKKYRSVIENELALNDLLTTCMNEWKARAENAEAELAALKKDARMCAEIASDALFMTRSNDNELADAVKRVLAATEIQDEKV